MRFGDTKFLPGGFLIVPCLVLALSASADSGPRPVSVTDVRVWSNPGFARVVIHLDGPVRFKYNRLKSSTRIYVDILGASIRLRNSKRNIKAIGVLKGVRIGKNRPLIPRVVLDLNTVKTFKVFALSGPNRIVVDVKGVADPTPSNLSASFPDAANLRRKSAGPLIIRAPKRKTPSVPGRTPLRGRDEKRWRPSSRAASRRTPIEISIGELSLSERFRRGLGKVVIDPGHGGKDPGAIGRTGIYEKDIVLDLSRRMARILRRKLRSRVYPTRNRDVFVSLKSRTASANRKKADLFVSVHANSAENRRLSGIETYLLSEVSGPRAMKVAARENGVSSEKLSDLQIIKTDLRMRDVINRSFPLAESVQKSMFSSLSRRYSRVRNLGVKQAPFHVLSGTEMPSILIETGFVSNRREERRLASPRYRQTLAESIVRGLQNFIERTELARQID